MTLHAEHNKVSLGILDPDSTTSGSFTPNNAEQTIEYLVDSWLKLQDKDDIIMVYNSNYHYILVFINLKQSTVELWDPMNKGEQAYMDMTRVLNR